MHWIVAMIPVPFIVVWNCWALPDIFLLFSFPIPRKSTVLSIYLKKMRFVARKAPD